ncbi:MAG: citramalate synthase [Clostridia bacterium]|nr:citramalate synthase [Clostridia bacterium]
MNKIYVYDTTLRDGTQGEGIAFSVSDKLKIIKLLDELGVSYIEAGIPASNPKDTELFARIPELKLKHAKIAAFGSTHRIGISVEEDPAIQALIDAETPVVTIFGKAWDLHVKEVFHAELSENLAIVRETVAYLKSFDKEVFFDAEHFFDGFKHNKAYALSVLEAAASAGAGCLCLCDTNGATFPDEVSSIVKEVKEHMGDIPLAIHCHNDIGVAVSNTLMGVFAGATQVQGTMNGFGERCGNANLCTIIPNLQLKRGYDLIDAESLKKLKSISRHIYELANLLPDERKPYVGGMAFTHKGGMHIDAVLKNPATFEHISPEHVGNERKLLMSDMSGRALVYDTIRRFDSTVEKDAPVITEILDETKKMENEGYQFDGAEASFELMILKKLGYYKPQFDLKEFKVIASAPAQSEHSATAMIKITVDGAAEITAAEGDGPVNALDKALRKALYRFYPELKKTRLIDFKVRVLNGAGSGTAAQTRVLMESTDGAINWSTVGVSEDILEASWCALVDSIDYYMLNIRHNLQKGE